MQMPADTDVSMEGTTHPPTTHPPMCHLLLKAKGTVVIMANHGWCESSLRGVQGANYSKFPAKFQEIVLRTSNRVQYAWMPVDGLVSLGSMLD